MKNFKFMFFAMLLMIFSQFSTSNVPEDTDEVIVTAQRIPIPASKVIGTVETITSDELNIEMVDGLQELVRHMPGISSHKETEYGRSLTKTIHIRGIHGGAIYLIDGVRLADSYAGFGRDTVETDLLKGVEIIKGPSSVEHGSDGLAGTIAYTTKNPSDLTGGGEKYLAANASYNNANKQNKLNLLGAYINENTEGLIQLVSRDLKETEIHEDFSLSANPMEGDQESLFAKLIITPSQNTEITFVADFQDWESDWLINSEIGFIYFPTPRAISSSSGQDEGTRERLSVNLGTTKERFLFDSANVSIYVQDTEQKQITIQNQVSFLSGMHAAPIPTMRIRDFDFNQSTEGLVLEAFKTSGNHNIVYGIDLVNTKTERPRMLTEINLMTQIPSNDVDGETYPNKTFPDSETERKAFFFNDRYSLTNNSVLNFGFRYDDYKLDTYEDALLQNGNILDYQIYNTSDDALSLKLGYLLDLNESLTLFAQYSEGFKAPDYETSNSVFTNYLYHYTVIPNPNLDSEESKSYEIGLRSSNESQSWEIALYNNKVDGFIQYEIIGFSQGLGVYQYQNINNVDIKGVELKFDRRISDQISYNFAFAASSGDQAKTDGTTHPMIHVDPKELMLGLTWRSEDEKWLIKSMLNIVDNSRSGLMDVCLNNSCDPRASTSGYGLLDIYASYNPSENLEFRLALENATDKKYKTWASVAMHPENDPDLDLYGQSGRGLSASLKYTF